MSMKIMVVDDEPKMPLLMTSLATPLGHAVYSFHDYQAAGQRGEQAAFDVVFVGVRLPEPSGLELASRIRNSPLNHKSIIVMLNAGDDVASRRKAFGKGADLVLTKPIPADSLRRMLAAFPEWKGRRVAARLPLRTEIICALDDRRLTLHSLNIGESGMLLQPSIDAELGREVALEFHLAEVRASVNVLARIVRKEGTERVGVDFIRLAPEHQNAIHLYLAGRRQEPQPQRDVSRLGARRIFGS